MWGCYCFSVGNQNGDAGSGMAVAVLVKRVCKDVVVSTNSISSLSVYILSKPLAENVDSENTEESSAGGAADKTVLSSSCPVRTADFTQAALAQDRGGRILNCGRADEENRYGL